ncbi:MAG: transcriptional regulator [SAR86 cluster bacterium]|uniref:Transcriptional regulator n=1 Tax=SAR86 cluster bacterium TaxID=2030880 RepID=A0A2A5AKA7_9GAMM|nr:MAG: transcriptional regulator [SAR86 cluster bacterium]
MKIAETTPHNTALHELGRRLALLRKQQGFTQANIANEAGLGVATVNRIEAGQDAQFSSWLKLFKVLGITSQLDVLLPEEILSPMAEVKKQRRQTRVSSKGTSTWGDGKS